MDPPGYKAPQKWRVRGVILDQHQARSKPHRITSSTIEVRILTLHTTLQHFLFQASLQHLGWRIASGFWFEYGSKACTPNFIGWFPEESIAPSLARLWIGVPSQFQHQSLRQGYLQWNGWRSSSPKTDLRRRKTTAVDLFMLVLVSKSRSLLHHILQNQNIDDMATVDQYSHLVSLVYVCSQNFRTFQRMQAPLSMTSSYKRNHVLSRRICSPSSIKVHRWNLHPTKLMPGFVNPNHQLVTDSTPLHTLGLRAPTWEAISWKGNRQYMPIHRAKNEINHLGYQLVKLIFQPSIFGSRHLNHIQIWLVDYEEEWLTMANCSPAKLP